MSTPELSVQLYTVRRALAEDFDGTLARLAGFGFTQVEPFGLLAHLENLRRLGEHGLSAPTTHIGLVADADLDAIFAAATELGIGTVIEPAVRAPQWRDAGSILATADALNAAAVRAAEHGLRVGYHNHWWEIEASVDGRIGLEVLADHLAPEVVLEVDTYWAHVGGADVPALLQRLGDRVVALHVKDGDGSLETTRQVAVGSGSLPVWTFLDAAPDALRVIELDDSEGDLLEAVRDSRTYLTAGKGA